MKRSRLQILSCVLLALLGGSSAHAQTFHFADGRKVPFAEARIKGANILVAVKIDGGGSAELTLPISTLNHIDWPAPAGIAAAAAELEADKPDAALAKINPLLAEQEPLREVPGSWWNQGAVIKAIALARLGKDVDADVVLERMRRAKASSADLFRVELAIVTQLVNTGKTDQARTRLAARQSSANDEDSRAALAIMTGLIAEKSGRAEEALLSYLRVPVFSPTSTALMPAALLGASRAYQQLGDTTRAADTLSTLKTRFPHSSESAQASR
ncbi:MAG: tetratricopeptide repeat protein [Rariglobus sp.]